MKWKYFFVTISAICVGLVFFIIFVSKLHSIKRVAVPSGELSLIVEPDDGIAPVLNAIAGAKSSVDLVMYELDDAQIEAALVADQKRGVAMRVILSGGYKGASSTMNVAEYNFLNGKWRSCALVAIIFSLTHENPWC